MQTELFFNTIHLKGQELKEVKESCSRQEERVYGLFVTYGSMTPAECSMIYNDNYPNTPLTSIRRAITVLTERGKLEKLDEMKEGNFGKRNHKWRAVIND